VIISTGNPDFFLELSPELVPEPNGQEESQRCDLKVREVTPTGLPSFPIPPPAVISVLTKPGQTIVMLT
jgi:hypothetical protein